MRYFPFILVLALSALFFGLYLTVDDGFLWPFALTAMFALVGVLDLLQARHSLLRNYPVSAHLRWLFEGIRPEIRQYFGESDIGGTPFDREHRSLIYARAKNTHEESPYGTDLDLYAEGHEWFNHSLSPLPAATDPFRVVVGGPACKRPYEMSLLNVSAMSFGALSANAIRALNMGAKMGGFIHDTGEGGLSDYHLENGGDIVWEIGTAYFGCRTKDGKFDPEMFRAKVNVDNVKCVSIKLSQGAKPGLGGVMPGAKVTPEIARIRGVPVGEKCVSPSHHTTFSTPRGLIKWLDELRTLSGGRPTGFKLCIGRKSEFLALCKAMIDMEIYPDFIIVDGSEGGTGAAPLEFEDRVGTPLTEGLIFVQNALVGCGLRDMIRIGVSGKITSGFTMARAMALGADYCNSARGMMFALGCIQAKRCHTNNCPVGVATQDPLRAKALVVEDKAQRVYHYQQNTVASFNQIIASLGLKTPDQLTPSLLYKRDGQGEALPYDMAHNFLSPGELLKGCDDNVLSKAWALADPDSFTPKS
ncbi:MAG: FMN-binding glutamate synthase family protein [Rhodospirillaceae bacterium]|jgi:glutamate synthase domain-containing protein 2|nr:FMN-binding glutamate synthase family protein [Rhodospirillaceae bacterium]MBT5751914.1 FMN-binding glutamate synthase family protein [Rhodospirillaceae bacterium]